MSNLKSEFDSWGGFEGYCEVCGDYSRLQRHHTSYSPEERISICSDCHYKIHQKPGFHDELNPFSQNYEDNKAAMWGDEPSNKILLVEEKPELLVAHKASGGEAKCERSEGDLVSSGVERDMVPKADCRCTHCFPDAL